MVSRHYLHPRQIQIIVYHNQANAAMPRIIISTPHAKACHPHFAPRRFKRRGQQLGDRHPQHNARHHSHNAVQKSRRQQWGQHQCRQNGPRRFRKARYQRSHGTPWPGAGGAGKGTATANPSGILCRAIASAVRPPAAGPRRWSAGSGCPPAGYATAGAPPLPAQPAWQSPGFGSQNGRPVYPRPAEHRPTARAASIPPSSSAAAAAPQPKGESSAP